MHFFGFSIDRMWLEDTTEKKSLLIQRFEGTWIIVYWFLSHFIAAIFFCMLWFYLANTSCPVLQWINVHHPEMFKRKYFSLMSKSTTKVGMLNIYQLHVMNVTANSIQKQRKRNSHIYINESLIWIGFTWVSRPYNSPMAPRSYVM